MAANSFSLCCMKFILSVALFSCFQFSFAQKLDIASLENILHASLNKADTLLKRAKFGLADKKTEGGYYNAYYTAFEKVDSTELLRTLTIMEVYEGADTFRFMLYRTYNKKDQDELQAQLTTAGYQLVKRAANDFTYKKREQMIVNRMVEKDVGGTRKVMVYEFELAR